MIVHVLCSMNKPLRIYDDWEDAYSEYCKLTDMDDFVDYAVISLPIQRHTPNKIDTPDGDGRCRFCGAGNDSNHSFTCPTGLHPDRRE